VTDQPDDRSPVARAAEWATAAITVGVEMVAPILIGAWLDARLGVKFVFVALGGILGMSAGIWSLVRIVEPLRRRPKESNSENRRREPPP
jgi:F0F1-type ATP synthase assembly protein I